MTLSENHLIVNDDLLKVALKIWPNDRLAAVCSCGAVVAAEKIGGHIGGSNKKWTVKAKFADRHRVLGYTLLAPERPKRCNSIAQRLDALEVPGAK